MNAKQKNNVKPKDRPRARVRSGPVFFGLLNETLILTDENTGSAKATKVLHSNESVHVVWIK